MDKPAEKSLVERLRELMHVCLFDDSCGSEPAMVKGIAHSFLFDRQRVVEQHDKIRELLEEMPEAFHKRGGGGWSFLNMCHDRHGVQWGEHLDMEALICLGIAAGMARWALPRELWRSMPGGMPYVVIDTSVAAGMEVEELT